MLGSALHASGRVRATGRRHRAHCLRACYNSEFVGFRKCGEKFSSRSSSRSSSFRFTVVPPKSWLPIRSPSVARCPSGTHCLFVVAIAIYLPLALHLGRMRTRAHSAPLHRLLTYNQWQRQTTRRPQRRRATREQAKSSSSVPPRINTDYIRSCRCRVVCSFGRWPWMRKDLRMCHMQCKPTTFSSLRPISDLAPSQQKHHHNHYHDQRSTLYCNPTRAHCTRSRLEISSS